MTISRKLTIFTVGMLVLVCSTALYIHFRFMMINEKEGLESMGITVGRVIEEGLAYNMIANNEDLLNQTLHDLQNVGPVSRILLLNNEDVVMVGTDANAAGKTLPFVDRQTVSDGGTGTLSAGEQTFRWVQGVRNRPECHACHSPSSKFNGSILIDFSTMKIENGIRLHVVTESLIFMGAFSIIGFAMFLFSNTVMIKRLDRGIDCLTRFKNGDETARMPVSGNDEITKLSQGFNEMANAVVESKRELKNYADQLLALAVSSNIVTAVSRTENLYDAVCAVATRELKLTMAWIGLVKKGSFEVEPAGQSGFEEGYLSTIRITWDDAATGMGPTGMAMKKRVPQVVNDITTEPAYRQWRDEAMKRGYRSSMALPLLSSSGELFGVLNLYSDEPNYFTHKRTRMFMIFSNQISTEIENRTLMESVEKSREDLSRQFEIISRSQKEWQMTFDSITDLVTIHDRDFKIIKANKAVSEYLGLAPHEIIGNKCYTLFHNTNCPLEYCPHRGSLDQKQVMTEEVREPRTGTLFRISTFPYYSTDGEFMGSVHVARDITREKETEMRLIMSERLAALGQMASGLAHEINTPLASIAGCAEGLLMRVRRDRYEPILFEEYLQIVEEEIQRCKSITTGMLSFVRTSTYEKKDVRINEAMDKTLEIIGFQGRLQDVGIDRRYQENLPAVHGSDGEIRQVFLAIVMNALDAMEEKGTLTVETTAAEEMALIRIIDSGPGIAPEHISRIFDPFYTTKSEKGGTGLGLSIAYKIITNHKGTIDVASEEGKGCTFTIALPIPASV